MNIFELSAVATPLVGILAGVMSVKTPGVVAYLLAMGAGLVLGLLSYAGTIGISALIVRLGGTTLGAERLGWVAWGASFAAVLAPMASPVAAAALSHFVVKTLLLL